MSFIQQLQTITQNGSLSRRQALLGLSLLVLTACSRKTPAASAASNVAYYTCTMHPFVRSHDPKGKCPVCGMDLVPVTVSKAATNAAPSAAASVGNFNGLVTISPERMQEIGAITEVVRKRPDVFAEVSGDSPVSAGLTISSAAVLPTGNKYIVFVDHGAGQLEPREIEVGRQTADYYEVISGLREGDRVINGANFLIDSESRIQGVLKTWGDRS